MSSVYATFVGVIRDWIAFLGQRFIWPADRVSAYRPDAVRGKDNFSGGKINQRKSVKYVHVGQNVAEGEVELLEDATAWSHYLSL